MADIYEVAEALCNLTTKEVNELATVMKSEYGIEASVCAIKEREASILNPQSMSPKQYGMQLMSRKQKHKSKRPQNWGMG